MPLPADRLVICPTHLQASAAAAPETWWSRLTPQRQDRFAMLAPLAAVLLFLAAILSAFGYLRLEEIDARAGGRQPRCGIHAAAPAPAPAGATGATGALCA